MREIRTEIEIDAPAKQVWHTLTDFAQFAQWNPFIREAEGKVEEGMQLEVHIKPPGGRTMMFKPTVKQTIPERELRWLGHLWVPGLFDGEHIFELEPRGENKVCFVQRERFSGILVPLLWKSLDRNTRQGFKEMNAALKEKAEEEYQASTSAT